CEGKPLRVTVSLYTGLKRLRRQDIIRVLWADAVCINQKDTLEKNAQLPLMGRIYSQPSRVPVWLG
ncbi:heterokaryon incompatibility, partial [Thermothelomyces heterothallicus CBS 202.75]|uniref:heterokaryon incompatibility n=1 Tax=Thermothelomyces heterothallicus CBS 202.75 TaxID=1149848 RepID=UPI003742C3C1